MKGSGDTQRLMRFIKRCLPNTFRQQLKRQLFAHHDMLTRLGNLKRGGFFPRDVIDVGAFEGEWTADFWKVWPGCSGNND